MNSTSAAAGEYIAIFGGVDELQNGSGGPLRMSESFDTWSLTVDILTSDGHVFYFYEHIFGNETLGYSELWDFTVPSGCVVGTTLSDTWGTTPTGSV